MVSKLVLCIVDSLMLFHNSETDEPITAAAALTPNSLHNGRPSSILWECRRRRRRRRDRVYIGLLVLDYFNVSVLSVLAQVYVGGGLYS